MKSMIPTLSVALLLAIFPTLGLGTPPFTEDFTTTEFRDDANTTADWNTASSELKLFPFVPESVGQEEATGPATGLAFAGDWAYVAAGAAGLEIFDISDPEDPVAFGLVDTPGQAMDVFALGNFAYVADGASGLQIIDITDAAATTIVGSLDTSDFANAVHVSGDLACVADNAGGVVLIDVTDPTNPVHIATLPTQSLALDVFIEGHHVYIADGEFGIMTLDISDFGNLFYSSWASTPGIAFGITVSGRHAYVADGNFGLQVFDISDPTFPVIVGTLDTSGSAEGVSVAGNLAFLAAGTTGVHVIDISEPTAPSLRFTYDTVDSANDISWAGEFLFVAEGFTGLNTLRIGTVAPPHTVGHLPTLGDPLEVKVAGDRAYVNTAAGRVEIVDISNPGLPDLIGFHDAGADMHGLWVEGNLVYAANGSDDFEIVDVADPANPILLGSVNLGTTAIRIHLSGNVAYLTGLAGLVTVDVSDPTNPVILNPGTSGGLANDVVVDGDLAYVTAGLNGLEVWDVSDPALPTALTTLSGIGYAGRLDIEGNLVVVNAPAAARIIDVADPIAPVEIGIINIPLPVSDVAISGGIVFFTGPTLGLAVYDLLDPTNPTLLFQENVAMSEAISVAGEYAYVTDRGLDGGETSLEIVQVFQSEVSELAGFGRSLAVDDTDGPIRRVRLSTEQTAGVEMRINVHDNAFQPIPADGAYHELTHSPTDIIWESAHFWSPGINPTLTTLEIDWLFEHAFIAEVDDIVNDQGGQVRVTWKRSGHDFPDDSTPVAEYAVYRAIDPDLGDYLRAPLPEDLSHVARDHAELMLSLGWDFLTTVPVLQEDNYSVVVPTLADSTESGSYFSTFRVTALTATPGQFFHSPPDSGQSVDNLAPAAPTNLVLDDGALTWDEAPEPDFDYFTVYGSNSDLLDGNAELIGHTTATTLDVDGHYFAFFHLTATDFSGNEGPGAATGAVSDVPGASAKETTLHAASPNPFNPRTLIAFDLQRSVAVHLAIFDLSGRRIATLIGGETLEAGPHERVWSGKDDTGRELGAGVYLYRLQAGDSNQTRRMTLVK